MASREFMNMGKGLVFECEKGVWKQTTEERINQVALEVEGMEVSTMRRRSEIRSAILASTRKDPPEWNDVGPKSAVFKNGVLDLETLVLRPLTSDMYVDKTLPHVWGDWDESKIDAQTGFFESIMRTWWGQEADEKITLVSEYMGYSLMSSAPYKTALICYGQSNTGKSALLSMVRALVGDENCCGVPVRAMGDSRQIAPIVGKMVNIVPEVGDAEELNEQGFKSLVSVDEPVLVDQKYRDAFFYTPTAKHIIACNNLPTIRDSSDGLLNRMVVVTFDHVLSKAAQDPFLGQKIRNNIPGLIGMAIAGARSLIENNGRFSVPQSSIELMEDYVVEQSAVRRWLEARTEIADANEYSIKTTNDEILRDFKDFTDGGGSWTIKGLSAKLRNMGFKSFKSGQTRGFRGIKLR